MTSGNSLEAEAQRFAAELIDTVRGVVGAHVEAFRARALHHPQTDRVSVHQEPRTGVPLTVGGVPLLYLTGEYRCVWDSQQLFLAVETSAVKVYAGAKADSEPLFHYEYARPLAADAHEAASSRKTAGYFSRRARKRSTNAAASSGLCASATSIRRMVWKPASSS